VDKSNETVQIYKEINQWNQKNNDDIQLWALLDGVGYSENKSDTINKLIKNVDNFMQIKSLYKAPLILHKLNLLKIRSILFSKFYDKEDIDNISRLYIANDIDIVNKRLYEKYIEIKCGEAIIYI
jgi:hypothetical protein